jgi:hypothetical protein
VRTLLSLPALNDDARKALQELRITLAHAAEMAKLQTWDQSRALEAVYAAALTSKGLREWIKGEVKGKGKMPGRAVPLGGGLAIPAAAAPGHAEMPKTGKPLTSKQVLKAADRYEKKELIRVRVPNPPRPVELTKPQQAEYRKRLLKAIRSKLDKAQTINLKCAAWELQVDPDAIRESILLEDERKADALKSKARAEAWSKKVKAARAKRSAGKIKRELKAVDAKLAKGKKLPKKVKTLPSAKLSKKRGARGK